MVLLRTQISMVKSLPWIPFQKHVSPVAATRIESFSSTSGHCPQSLLRSQTESFTSHVSGRLWEGSPVLTTVSDALPPSPAVCVRYSNLGFERVMLSVLCHKCFSNPPCRGTTETPSNEIRLESITENRREYVC